MTPEATAEVRPLAPASVDDAVGVLARGMRDNPAHVAVFGDDPEYRVRALTGFFGSTLPMQSRPIEAVHGDATVGVCGLAPPGECLGDLLRALGGEVPTLSEDPGEQARIVEWISAWGARDLEERHWHLGPIAADAHLQGNGIGSALMERFCAVVDDAHDVAYLETDKAVNVGFYERFGFETIAQADVLATPNWFMRRAAAP